MSKLSRAFSAARRRHHLGANLLLDRAQIEKDRLAPELVASKVPYDKSSHSHALSSGLQAEKITTVRSAPFILGHDALFVRGKDSLHADVEVRKTSPVFAITFGDLLGADEGLGHAGNIVKAIGSHSIKESFHIVRAFGLDVLAKHRESSLRYPHLASLQTFPRSKR